MKLKSVWELTSAGIDPIKQKQKDLFFLSVLKLIKNTNLMKNNMDLMESGELHSQSLWLIKKELLTPTNEHVDNKVAVFWKDDD